MLTKKEWVMVTVTGMLGGLWITGNLHQFGMF